MYRTDSQRQNRRTATVTMLSALLVLGAGCAFDSDALDGLSEGTDTSQDSGTIDTSQDVSDATGVCGDGTLNTGESCDDGNNTDGDGCSASCEFEASPTCGDGNLDPSEECDDGNEINGDGCSSACRLESGPECGDGVVESPEGCDDGNASADDGCSSTCIVEEGWECLRIDAPCVPICADGLRVGAELEGNGRVGDGCDDGNRQTEMCETFEACTTCGPDCVVVEGIPMSTDCGDGVIEGSEGCDEGDANTDHCPYSTVETSCNVCTTACVMDLGQRHFCGDDVIDTDDGEVCDEGGVATCPYGEGTCEVCDDTCTGRVSAAGPYCGDGIVNGDEVCDGGIYCDDTCNETCVHTVDWRYATTSVVHLWLLSTTNVYAGSGEEGFITIRYMADDEGAIVPGPVSLVEIYDPWDLSIGSGQIVLNYDLVGESADQCGVAFGTLSGTGQLDWATCEAHRNDDWLPADGADGAGCIAGYHRSGHIECEEGYFGGCVAQTSFLGSGGVVAGVNARAATWDQPLNGMLFSRDFRSFGMLNSPHGAPDDLFGARQWGTESPDEYPLARTFFSFGGNRGVQVEGSLVEQCAPDPACVPPG